MTKKLVGIVGTGAIGTHLRKRLEALDFSVMMIDRENVYIDDDIFSSERTFVEKLDHLESKRLLPRVLCLAISTKDCGDAAFEYISHGIASGIPVVTCEKGALAYHFENLSDLGKQPNAAPLLMSASVGGGTQMTQYVASRNPLLHEMEIDAVLNGTLNYVFDEVAGNQTLGEVCAQASKLGYAEPGNTGPLSLINGELKDVILKVCVFANMTLREENGPFLHPAMFEFDSFKLTGEQLAALNKVAYKSRLVVSFSKNNDMTPSYAGNHCSVQFGPWTISIGFRDITHDVALAEWLPAGVGNAVHIVEGPLGAGGGYTLTGPGAGLEPTTTAMINDIARLQDAGTF